MNRPSMTYILAVATLVVAGLSPLGSTSAQAALVNGNIAVYLTDGATLLGYVSTSYGSEVDSFTYSSDQSSALQVQFDSAESTFAIKLLNPPASNIYFGAVEPPAREPLAPGSYGAVLLTGTSLVAQDTYTTAASNDTQFTNAVESTIWSLSSDNLKGQWTNSDGSTFPNITYYNPAADNLGLSGDLAAFNDHFADENAYEVILRFTPVPEPASWSLLAFGGMLAVCRRRRSSGSRFSGQILALVMATVLLSSTVAQAANPLPDGYISETGMDDSPATLVPAGYYASDDHTQAIPASPGSYIPSAGAQGAISQIPAPVGAYVSGSAATSFTLASVGHYVDTTGATSQTQAPLGAFVATSGASNFTLASPGHYVDTLGASSQTQAPLGTYVPGSGASATTPAAPGYYVPTTGATSAIQAPLGTYVPGSGASAATPAAPGYYVPTTGATSAIQAPLGTYVPGSGASAATPAAPGYYVPTTGATSAVQAPHGYFVPTSGQSAPTPAPVGYYVPTTGATAALPAPVGTTAPEIASFAVRSSDPLVPRGGDVIGPIYDSFTAPNDPIALGSIAGPTSFTLDLKNISSDLGFSSLLTDLSLLSFSITGLGAGDVSVLNWNPSLVLHEGDSYLLQLQVAPSATGSFSPTLTIFTDEFAPVGMPGASYSYPIEFSAVPEPSTISMSICGGIGIGGALLRRRRLRLGKTRRSVAAKNTFAHRG